MCVCVCVCVCVALRKSSSVNKGLFSQKRNWYERQAKLILVVYFLLCLLSLNEVCFMLTSSRQDGTLTDIKTVIEMSRTC